VVQANAGRFAGGRFAGGRFGGGRFGISTGDAIASALSTRAGMSWQPWNLSTLFTDTAATVPATAPGDIIAVQVDPSRGTLPGPELVTNGDFASDTWWSKGTGWTISGGKANKSPGIAENLSRPAFLTIGNVYEVTYTVTDYVAGSAFTLLGTTSSGPSRTANGTYTERRVASGDTSFYIQGNSTFQGSIDNVSVKLLPYNYFAQSTLANRPILVRHPKRGRVNLLTPSQAPVSGGGMWNAPSNATVVESGDTFTITATGIVDVGYRTNHNFAINTQYTVSIEADYISCRYALVRNIASGHNAWFDLLNGLVATVDIGGSATITDLGDGFYKCTLTSTTGGIIINNLVDFKQGSVDGNVLTNVIGQSTAFRKAQIELGSTATNYQRVVSTYDVTESGQSNCWGLLHDGTNDSMATAATLDLSASDKVAVFSGVQRLNNSPGIIAELSAIWDSNTASFAHFSNNADNYVAGSRGAAAFSPGAQSTPSASSFVAPSYDVFTSVHNISGDLTTVRVDGAVSGTPATGDKGTGNFGNYTLFKGARNSSSFFLNGIDWGGAVVGGLDATTDAAIISAIERQIANNTPGVTF
jgi:hypothetical protein